MTKKIINNSNNNPSDNQNLNFGPSNQTIFSNPPKIAKPTKSITHPKDAWTEQPDSLAKSKKILDLQDILDIQTEELSSQDNSSKAKSSKKDKNSKSQAAAKISASGPAAPASLPELARALKYNVDLIYEWVYSNVDYIPVWGIHKGLFGTLVDRQGGPFEQAALMLNLLAISGYTCNYIAGTISLTAAQIENLLGTNDSTVPTTTEDILLYGQIPNECFYDGSGNLSYVNMAHVWVQVDIDGTNYVFDPSLKTYDYVSGIDIGSAISFNLSSLISDVEDGATVTSDYVQNLNTANLASNFSSYANDLLSYIQTNNFDSSTLDVLGGRKIQPLTNTSPLRQTVLPYQTIAAPTYTWADIPNYYRAIYEVAFAGFDIFFYADFLYGRRLTITFNSSNQPELRYENILIATGAALTPDLFYTVSFGIYHPFSDPFADKTWNQSIYAPGFYLLGIYYFNTTQAMVDHHRQILKQNIANGGASDSNGVFGESLAVYWYNYGTQNSMVNSIYDQLASTQTFLYNFPGIIGFDSFHNAIYCDLNGVSKKVKSLNGDSSLTDPVFSATDMISNAFESGIMQQNLPVIGIATPRLLDAANTDTQKTFDATSSNWYSSIRSQLVNWDDYLDLIDSFIDAGNKIVIHEDGTTSVESYTGGGFLKIQDDIAIGGVLQGHVLGGTCSQPVTKSQVNTAAKDGQDSTKKPDTDCCTTPCCSDPVNMFSGAFIYGNKDFSLGSGQFPYSLEFERSYDSAGMYNDSPLGFGWSHNFDSSLSLTSFGIRGLGEVSPKEAAAAIAHSYVMLQIPVASGSLTEILIGSLSSLWLMDQITNNAIVLSHGADSQAFIKLADGTFNPPPSSADVLTDNLDGTYTLTNPQQQVWNFNDFGKTSEFIDPAGVTVTYSYDGSHKLTSVSNNLDRTLTLSYSGSRISSISDGNGRSVSYSFDSNGNLTSFTDAEGNSTTFSYLLVGQLEQYFLPANPSTAFITNVYDSLNRIMEQIPSNEGTWSFYIAGSRSESVDPLGHSEIDYYNSIGSSVKSIDASGNITTYEFDGLFRLINTTFPEGNIISNSYDEKNNILSITWQAKPGSGLSNIVNTFTYSSTWNKVATSEDGEGNTTTFTYDGSQGTLLTITRPTIGGLTPEVVFTYNSRGQILTRTDETGMVDAFTYSTTNETLLTSTRDYGSGQLNLVTTFGYDDIGNITSITDPRGNETTFAFDNQRRMTQRTECSPFNFVTNWLYDDNGQLLTLQKQTGLVSPAFQEWNWTYSVHGDILTTSDPATHLTTNVYNDARQLISVTDAESRQWQYSYDLDGRLATVTDPMSNISETRTYTDNGLLATITDARSNTTSMEYDGFDRLSKTTYPDSTFEQNSYNDNNQVLTTLTRIGDTITNTYDVLTRLATRQPGSSLGLQTMSYDLANRLLQISTPVISGNPGTGAFQYDYDTAGRLITQTMPNSLAINYQLDQNGNRIKLTWPDSYFADYVFDELNRLTDIKLNGSSGSAVQIGYDDLSRRTSITYENGTSCAYAYQIDNNMSDLDWTYASESVSYDFDYNNVYQVIGQTVSDESYLWAPSENLITSYASANSLNQYPSVAGTSFSYSDNGNLTAGPLSASYDALNRLTQVVNGSVTNNYWYDPTNRQIQKSVNGTKSYYLNDGLQEIARYNGSGTLTDRFIPSIGLDEVLISISGSTKTYLHKDRLGSVIAESDNTGAVLNKFAYTPFGSSDAISSTGFGYTGQRYDSEVGLYNYRARYYSPALGRFLQPDPIGFAGGMNFYAYVSNDAVNLVDPLGLAPPATGMPPMSAAQPILSRAEAPGAYLYSSLYYQHTGVFIDFGRGNSYQGSQMWSINGMYDGFIPFTGNLEVRIQPESSYPSPHGADVMGALEPKPESQDPSKMKELLDEARKLQELLKKCPKKYSALPGTTGPGSTSNQIPPYLFDQTGLNWPQGRYAPGSDIRLSAPTIQGRR